MPSIDEFRARVGMPPSTVEVAPMVHTQATVAAQTAQSALSDISNVAIGAGLGPVIAALDNLIANPTQLNSVAQLAVLQGAFVGALPMLQTTGIKDGAIVVKQLILALQAKLQAQATQVAASVAGTATAAEASADSAAAEGTSN